MASRIASATPSGTAIRATPYRWPDPNQTADVTKLARETGLPPALVEDRVDQVKRDLAAGKLVDVLNRDPALAKWAADNPRAAATALGDHRSIAKVSSAFRDISKGYLAERPEAAYKTALGVLVMGGAMGGLNQVVTRLSNAETARSEAAVIDRLGRVAQTSILRERDPDGYQSLLKHNADAVGATEVYLPADLPGSWFSRSGVYE